MGQFLVNICGPRGANKRLNSFAGDIHLFGRKFKRLDKGPQILQLGGASQLGLLLRLVKGLLLSLAAGRIGGLHRQIARNVA